MGQLFYNPIDTDFIDTFVSYFEVQFEKLPYSAVVCLSLRGPGPSLSTVAWPYLCHSSNGFRSILSLPPPPSP